VGCRRFGSDSPRPKKRANVVDAARAWKSADVAQRGNFVSAEEHAEIAAVVVTYNSSSDISELIDDLRLAARDCSLRLIVVDNQSTDETVNIVRAHRDILLVDAGGNLGYAGGINVGLGFAGSCDNIMILNPDLSLAPDAVTQLLAAATEEGIGAVVPLMLDENGSIYPSLGREPTLSRAIGDALVGGKIRLRPSFSSGLIFRRANYLEANDVDWAMGAALLIPAAVARVVGEWNEEFFLYSEEVDYFRRIRATGWRIRFEPSAVVKHRGGGSGRSPALAALRAVNRIRYIERYHGRLYSAVFRAVVTFANVVRSYKSIHRHTVTVLLSRKRWDKLPRAEYRVSSDISQARQWGSH
jgi:GT2 family glycosyltransferase